MRKLGYCVFASSLIAGIAFAYTDSALGPLASHTGAPAVGAKPEETNCTLCHFNVDWNNLNTKGGAVEILGLPKGYMAGQTYPLTVRLHSDSTAAYATRKWGFQISAVRASDGEGSGTFQVASDSIQVLSGDPGPYASRWYVEHAINGTRAGLFGPVTWTFDWHAPNPPEGKVYFFAAGNAADGTQDPGNDFVFTTADSVADATVPVRAVSWGALKTRYR